MPNITIQLDQDLYRRIRIYAAYRDTTATQMVREFFANTIPAGFSAERAELAIAMRKFPALSRFAAGMLGQFTAQESNTISEDKTIQTGGTA